MGKETKVKLNFEEISEMFEIANDYMESVPDVELYPTEEITFKKMFDACSFVEQEKLKERFSTFFKKL